MDNTVTNGTTYYYEVVAANAYGSVTSAVVQLTVESGAPAFLWQDLPASQTVFVGHIIQLHVAPSGTALNVGTGTGTEQFALDVTGAGTQQSPSKFRFLVREASGQGDPAQSSVVPYDPLLLQPTWHHLVGVYEGLSISIYVDGALQTQAPCTNQPITYALEGGTPTAEIAAKSYGASTFSGTLDQIAIWNRALTPTEITSLYGAGSGRPVP